MGNKIKAMYEHNEAVHHFFSKVKSIKIFENMMREYRCEKVRLENILWRDLA